MERVEEVVAVYIEQQPEEAVSMALEGGGRGLLVSAVVPACVSAFNLFPSDLFSFCFGGKLKQRHHTVENPGRPAPGEVCSPAAPVFFPPCLLVWQQKM